MRIKSTAVYLENGFEEAVLELENGKITGVFPASSSYEEDYGDACILPGFLDIHTHGGYGVDTNTSSVDELLAWAKRLPEEGVTSFLPTTVTDHKDILLSSLRNVREVHKAQKEGARIIGIHMEGPFLNITRAGAQPKGAIIPPSIPLLKDFVKEADGLLSLMTIAPEKDEGHLLLKELRKYGIIPSIGHSSATYEECLEAERDGALSITHTFNAQSAFHHRDPGIVNFALDHKDFYSEIIGDGHHVDPSVLSFFFSCKDPDHAILISDSLSIKGIDEKDILFGGQKILIENGAAHLADEKKTLAGSILKINEGIAVLVNKAGVPVEKAVRAASINPARLLGLDDHIGILKEGYDADITILDRDFRVLKTIIKGKTSYTKTGS